MHRADIDGITLEYEVQGSGEPVIFIHGALFESFGPMSEVPPLKDRFRLIRYQPARVRREYGRRRSAHCQSRLPTAPNSLALWRRSLRTSSAIHPGRSSPFSLPSILPRPCAHSRSWSLPCLLFPARDQLFETLGQTTQMYEAGDKAGAFDTFMRAVCGKTISRCDGEAHSQGRSSRPSQTRTTFLAVSSRPSGEWTFDPGRRRPHQAAGPRRSWRRERRMSGPAGARGTSCCCEWFRRRSRSSSPAQPTSCRSRTPTIWRKVWRPSLRADSDA